MKVENGAEGYLLSNSINSPSAFISDFISKTALKGKNNSH